MVDHVEAFIIRKCKMVFGISLGLDGRCLKIVEISYCNIREMPIICSDVIEKINLSNNLI